MLQLLMTTCLIGTILFANSIDASATNDTQNIEPEAKYSQYSPVKAAEEYPIYPEYAPTKNGNLNDNNNDNKNDINDKASNYSVVPLYINDMDDTWQSNLKKVLVPIKDYALTFGAHFFDIGLKTLYFVVVGLFTSSIVCSLTPICNFQLNGFGTSGVSERVQQIARSFMPGNGDVNELGKNVNAAQMMNSAIPEQKPYVRARRNSPYWMEELKNLGLSR